jgi:Xaa-Pro dipeptidase
MAEQGLDWLVLFHPVSIRWLTGSDAKSYQEFQCLLVPAADGPIAMMAREGERAEILDDALVDRLETFGGGENEDPIPRFGRLVRRARPACGPCRRRGAGLLPPPSSLRCDPRPVRLGVRRGDRPRSRSQPGEVAGRTRLHQAGGGDRRRDADNLWRGAACGPQRARGRRRGLWCALLARGSGLAASPINLVSGERSCYSHGAPTDRTLRAGDYGSVEYGATFRRYTATLGRQFCLGQPSARMRELHEIARRACDACIAHIRDGAPATAPHEAAKRVIGEAGLEHGRVHTSGYGLAPGFPPSWGEPMHMIGASRYTLRAGMVLSVEPPVFLHEEGLGARIIDNVLVTQRRLRIAVAQLARSDRRLEHFRGRRTAPVR